jgi:hypothetical protein
MLAMNARTPPRAASGDGRMSNGIDVVAVAMSKAWDQVRLPEKLNAMATRESEAFEVLASQLRVPLDELKRRAEQRCAGQRERRTQLVPSNEDPELRPRINEVLDALGNLDRAFRQHLETSQPDRL